MSTFDLEDIDLPGKIKEEKKEEFKHRQRRQSLAGQKIQVRATNDHRLSITSTGSWCKCILYFLVVVVVLVLDLLGPY